MQKIKLINMTYNFTILISGPTATGKSDFALQLGASYDNKIEIINADIGSFYKPLTIGTAKPEWQNSSIAHHFFDILDRPENWTAPQFRAKLEELIPQIWQRGNIPVIVGGSAFYIQSFFYKNYEMPTPDQLLIEKLEMQSSNQLWQQLYTIDPERAEQIEPNDQYRLVRALAIWYTQGQKPSDFKQIFAPLTPFQFIVLTRERQQLYEMINKRVEQMVEMGWIDEVKALLEDQDWIDFLYKKKMIGYNELIAYLQGYYAEQDFADVISLVQQRTRNYAKRQLTFLKKLAENIQHDLVKLKNEILQSSHVKCLSISEFTTDDIIKNIKKDTESKILYNP